MASPYGWAPGPSRACSLGCESIPCLDSSTAEGEPDSQLSLAQLIQGVSVNAAIYRDMPARAGPRRLGHFPNAQRLSMQPQPQSVQDRQSQSKSQGQSQSQSYRERTQSGMPVLNETSNQDYLQGQRVKSGEQAGMATSQTPPDLTAQSSMLSF
eukprot:352743-Chlamydomonas_euryale.AAC.20